MAITSIGNLFAVPLNYAVGDTTAQVLDAAGESAASIGFLVLERGATGSKTISSGGGGSIIWRSGAVTFANAGTNISVGIQDINLGTGFEDGTFDVKGDLTGGGGGITANVFLNTDMTSGTKTIAEGDLIAIVVEMTTRGGVDSVGVDRVITNAPIASYPSFYQGTSDTGSGPTRTGLPIFSHIIFDDGTVGWLAELGTCAMGAVSTFSVNSGSSPDEYIGTFTPAVPMRINVIGMHTTNIALTDNFEIILYSDPYGTPTVIQAVAIDPDTTLMVTSITAVTLAAGTTYGIAVRPTTANNITISYFDLTTGFTALKKSLSLPDIKVAGRTNQTGAFVEVQTYYIPLIAMNVIGFDDGASAGGGGGIKLAGRGGLAG